MASRKRSRLTLPSIDDLLANGQKVKQGFTDVKDCICTLRSIKPQSVGRQLAEMSENDKVCWLLAAYPITAIAKLCSLLANRGAGLSGMTASLRNDTISRYIGLSSDECGVLADYVQRECPVLIGMFAPTPDIRPVLSPPTSTCLNCGEGLIANHRYI